MLRFGTEMEWMPLLFIVASVSLCLPLRFNAYLAFGPWVHACTQEWLDLDCLLRVLEPFKIATKKLQAQKHPTVMSVVPITQAISDALDALPPLRSRAMLDCLFSLCFL
jgi:hypothetical protein